MLIHYKKNDRAKKKATIISLYLFVASLVAYQLFIAIKQINFIFQSSPSAIHSLPLGSWGFNPIPYLLLFAFFLASISLLYGNRFVRYIVLLVAYTFTLLYVFVLLKITYEAILYHFFPTFDFTYILIKFILNLSIIYLLSNEISIFLYRVKKPKKERYLLVILSLSFVAVFICYWM
jgi:hypothetical protein